MLGWAAGLRIKPGHENCLANKDLPNVVELIVNEAPRSPLCLATGQQTKKAARIS